jgi:hypothetical protein
VKLSHGIDSLMPFNPSSHLRIASLQCGEHVTILLNDEFDIALICSAYFFINRPASNSYWQINSNYVSRTSPCTS